MDSAITTYASQSSFGGISKQEILVLRLEGKFPPWLSVAPHVQLTHNPGCIVIVVWFFLTVPCVKICLQFVIVAFPNHTHLLFSMDLETP